MVDIGNVTSPTEFAQLEEAQLEDAARQCAAYMAYNQSIMAETQGPYYRHLAAKEAYSHFRQIGSVLQTLIRVGRG